MTVKRPLVLSVAAALALTVAALGVGRYAASSAGLVRSFHPQLAFAGPPLFQVTTSDLTLAFLQARPDLPKQAFSVAWQGIWFVPQEQTVVLSAAANDRVDLLIDGKLVLRRTPAGAGRPARRPIRLSAGSHAFAVKYQQFGTDPRLEIQWAPAGSPLRAFGPVQLFPRAIGAGTYWIVTRLGWWLTLAAVLAWLAPLALLLVIRAPQLSAAARRLFSRWRETGAPRTAREFGRRLWLVAFPALLGPAVVFFLGPHTIYATNRGEFSVPFSAVAVPSLLAAVGGGWALLLLAGCAACLLSERLTRVYAALVLAAGIILWAQGNLWVGHYGALDGREIDWSRLAWRTPYELAAWTLVPVIVVACRRAIGRVAPVAVVLFLGLQAGAMAITSAGPGGDAPAAWSEPPAALYQFSSRRNVIHLVLDEFQSDAFAEILEGDRPWFDQRMSGFVYFADHMGAFPTTSLAMPAMLTGREYRNEQPVPEFIRTAFRESSLIERLSRAGFEVDAASIDPKPWFEAWFGPEDAPLFLKAARFTIRKPFVSQANYRQFVGRQLLDLSVARHLPHVAKAALAAHPEWFDRLFLGERAEAEAAARGHEANNTVAFFRDFIGRVTVDREEPHYKLIHLGIPHRPVVVDRHCSFIGPTRFSRQAYVDQSRCAVDLVGSFLDRLRALGVYDSSLIIVSGDHGTAMEPRGFFGQSETLTPAKGPQIARLSSIAGTSKALMAIKPPGRTGPLTVSEAPTAHIDLPVTILDLLGLDHGAPGDSMFRRDPGTPRRRIYGMYDVDRRFPEGYLDRLDLLTVERRLVDAAGWNLQRTILAPGAR